VLFGRLDLLLLFIAVHTLIVFAVVQLSVIKGAALGVLPRAQRAFCGCPCHAFTRDGPKSSRK
jgi:hypothetical protein